MLLGRLSQRLLCWLLPCRLGLQICVLSRVQLRGLPSFLFTATAPPGSSAVSLHGGPPGSANGCCEGCSLAGWASIFANAPASSAVYSLPLHDDLPLFDAGLQAALYAALQALPQTALKAAALLFFLLIRRPPRSTLLPSAPLFRSSKLSSMLACRLLCMLLCRLSRKLL